MKRTLRYDFEIIREEYEDKYLPEKWGPNKIKGYKRWKVDIIGFVDTKQMFNENDKREFENHLKTELNENKMLLDYENKSKELNKLSGTDEGRQMRTPKIPDITEDPPKENKNP